MTDLETTLMITNAVTLVGAAGLYILIGFGVREIKRRHKAEIKNLDRLYDENAAYNQRVIDRISAELRTIASWAKPVVHAIKYGNILMRDSKTGRYTKTKVPSIIQDIVDLNAGVTEKGK